MTEKDPKSKGKWGSKPLLILALLSLLVGVGSAQYWLSASLAQNPFSFPPLAVFYSVGLAVIGLFVGVRTLSRMESGLGAEEESEEHGLRWPRFLSAYGRSIALALSVMSIIVLLWRLPDMSEADEYTAVFLLWLLAGALYLAAFAPDSSRLSGFFARWTSARSLLFAVGGLGMVAFLLRFYQVGQIPFNLAGDEGAQGLEAVRVLDGLLRNPFATGWLGVPTLSFFFNSWSIGLFGQNIFGLRFPWVIVGAATVVVVFFLVRRLVGTRLAWATAVILATYHYHIHFSRLGSNQIADPFFMALALLFLYRGLDNDSRFDWALAGAAAALGLYFYAGARLVPIVILVLLGYLFLRQPRPFWQKNHQGMGVALGAFLVVAAPMVQYAMRFPDDFNARLNQVGIIQSGWLAREVALRGVGVVAILWEQAQRAFLAFNYYPDRTVWYGLPGPLLAPFWGILFLVGMGYALLRLWGRLAKPRYAPMVAWWWGGMILGGVLTESPPSSQRLITLAVPVSFFLAVALWEGSRLITAVLTPHLLSRRLPEAFLLAGVGLFALSSLNTYFVEYTPQRLYGGSNAELATLIAPELRAYSRTHSFYFVGAPWMYWGFATLPYLVPTVTARDIVDSVVDPAAAAAFEGKPGEGVVFIFHSARLPEVALFEQAFPAGRREEIHSPVDGRLLGVLFVVPPGQVYKSTS